MKDIKQMILEYTGSQKIKKEGKNYRIFFLDETNYYVPVCVGHRIVDIEEQREIKLNKLGI